MNLFRLIQKNIKEIVNPNMKNLSFTNHQAVPNLYDCLFCLLNKRKIFLRMSVIKYLMGPIDWKLKKKKNTMKVNRPFHKM